MKATIRIIVITGLLLLMLLVNVPQATVSAGAPALRPFHDPPRGATVVRAFSEDAVACQGLMEWVVEAKPGNWIDVSIDWTAIDATTVLDNWPHLHHVITVDGLPVVGLYDYQRGPSPHQIVCPEWSVEGQAIWLKIYLPPMTPGDHTVKWTTTIDADINDGWGDYPAGSVEFTSTVRVKRPGSK
jgi:hypothetical protein